MGLRKKKNVIILTFCMVICFILYQLYFFLSITSTTSGDNRVVPVLEQVVDLEELVHVHPESDKYINSHGVIRGVLYYIMPRYRPNANSEFKCLKSEQSIPFEQVNDDYCDCEDASDEPSTNACANGTFYCDSQISNKRISPYMIPSSKINDGICDCCDGSDEWLHEPGTKLLIQANEKNYRYYATKCLNTCYINQDVMSFHKICHEWIEWVKELYDLFVTAFMKGSIGT